MRNRHNRGTYNALHNLEIYAYEIFTTANTTRGYTTQPQTHNTAPNN
jgi:hypothetical protein